MAWLRWFARERDGGTSAELLAIRRTFGTFTGLLDANKRVLEAIADLEEKAQGEHLFDVNYIRSRRAELRAGVGEIVERMIELGGEQYASLRARHAAIEAEIDEVLEGRRDLEMGR